MKAKVLAANKARKIYQSGLKHKVDTLVNLINSHSHIAAGLGFCGISIPVSIFSDDVVQELISKLKANGYEITNSDSKVIYVTWK